MLKEAKNRLLTRAVQNRDCVFASAYRTATVRESVADGLFRILFSVPRRHACRGQNWPKSVHKA